MTNVFLLFNLSMVDNVHEDVAKAQYFVSNLKMHIFADSLHFPNSSKTPGKYFPNIFVLAML